MNIFPYVDILISGTLKELYRTYAPVTLVTLIDTRVMYIHTEKKRYETCLDTFNPFIRDLRLLRSEKRFLKEREREREGTATRLALAVRFLEVPLGELSVNPRMEKPWFVGADPI